jgi:hypothetical protein
MPRVEAEKLPMDQCTANETKDWRCSWCGAIGQFASESIPEWHEFVVDLTYEDLAARLQEAGYEVIMYSAECDRGDHGDCFGKNRVTENSRWCGCTCHNKCV